MLQREVTLQLGVEITNQPIQTTATSLWLDSLGCPQLRDYFT